MRLFAKIRALLLFGFVLATATSYGEGLRAKVEGLLVGSLIGDAAGGPVEFRPPNDTAEWLPHCREWPGDQVLDKGSLERLSASFQIESYGKLRPRAEPYGPWTPDAPAGTLTDDTRNKIVFFNSLRGARSENRKAPNAQDLAAAYLGFRTSEAVKQQASYASLLDASLTEFEKASRWVLGKRDLRIAAPPERLWAGLPTCCGQMTMPPLAALYAGRPREAYLACYDTAFIDVGAAKDLNSALLAGLAEALVIEPPRDAEQRRAAWRRVVATMRLVDPLGYRDTPFVRRPVDRWMRFASNAASKAQGHPKRLYQILESEGEARTYWEAHATISAVFSVIELCDYEPLVAMTLLLDFGHDTDSTAQLLGAFVGAIHGHGVFPESMRDLVRHRLAEDYGESLDEWVDLLKPSPQE